MIVEVFTYQNKKIVYSFNFLLKIHYELIKKEIKRKIILIY